MSYGATVLLAFICLVVIIVVAGGRNHDRQRQRKLDRLNRSLPPPAASPTLAELVAKRDAEVARIEAERQRLIQAANEEDGAERAKAEGIAAEARILAAERRVNAAMLRTPLPQPNANLTHAPTLVGNTSVTHAPTLVGAVGERKTRTTPQDVKIAVALRDGGRCVQCGATEDIHYDHKVPWSRGGSNTVNNIQLLCGPCNRRKGATEGLAG